MYFIINIFIPRILTNVYRHINKHVADITSRKQLAENRVNETSSTGIT